MTTRHWSRWGALLLVAFTCRLAAQADTPGKFVPLNLRDADTNHNMLLEDAEIDAAMPAFLAEARQTAATLLKHFDTNHDGKLSPDERRALNEVIDAVRRLRAVEEVDADHDYQISPEEEKTAKAQLKELAAQQNKRVLAEADTNFDGVISAEERRAFIDNRREEAGRRAKKWQK